MIDEFEFDDDERDDGWTEAAADVTTPDRKVRVLSERCATCIIGGEQSITPNLRSGRLRALIQDAADGHIPCHSTLSNTEPHAAVCAGWFERFGMQSNYIRVMDRLGGLTFVSLADAGGGS